ncbi:MAG: type II 3-dehydroquinate dehydratase [Deltaproteobacteria bacterium]|nr:type II 3-dehydroquinate dehydratase [Deltaproteobacteria bacterium]MBW2317232.1 type II 3-dehydroquinate dehydratase [Deltaproteobacteria bacterium]MBW2601448.1 type II 3-dehydroquinate dehydratase [Deltaproteobacteria bacterium]
MQDDKERPQVLVLHGPNLDMLGQREPSLYGSATLDQIDAEIKDTAQRLDMGADCFQSNYEGALVEKLHEAIEHYDAVIINPAAFTHTSVAIRDALLMLDVPIIEVHLSNIYKRESFRHVSYVADVATARVAGFGKKGYIMAVEAVAKMVKRG